MSELDNYVVYHCHSMLSNGVTNIDSVTKFTEYIDAAKAAGMKALGFSEHGSVFEWWHKKCAIEQAGMKYLHGIEAYLTETLDDKVRDNYHCVLIARNYDGVLELNRMVSRSFNRADNHFYYVPRLSFDELFASSDNIIVTSACIGGVFGKGSEEVQQRMLQYMTDHRDRCFLEIGHHIDQKQVDYNRKLLDIANRNGIRLIAGTDTHVLNELHERGRHILQVSKNIHFDGEENWDLKFHNLDGLVNEYERQRALPEDVYLEAIANTNVLADMVEPFTMDQHTKYPHIYDNPEETFRTKVYTAMETHPVATKRYSTPEQKQILKERVEEELAVYEKTQSIDFMLLETYMREWEAEHGIECGPGRGSVSGSMVAYLLGITKMDSIRFGLNFFRFMNPDRVTNADIDTDYAGKDRDKVKLFLLRDRMKLPQIKTSEIITFNTIALKGAIRDVARALEIPLDEVSDIAKQCADDNVPNELRKKYKQLFDYVDIVNGTIVSVGTHPSGVLVSDLPIDELVGLCSVSSSDYPVSMLNMKELDDLMYVKLDILGLDNVGIINDTCKMLGIETLNPDNVDLEDMDVWKSIREDTTLIFQWESNSAQQYLRKLMSDKTLSLARGRTNEFSMIKWMSFGNGLIRPACASFRDDVAAGVFYDNGFKELNDFLAPEAGRIAMQETIMKFLVKFCGYSNAESDTVRRAIAKKKGTEKLLPEIKERFINFSSEHYDITPERCAEVIEPFIQVILDASLYAFSWNHSDSYSIIGYICGYLRYYHPVEFLTAALNTFSDNLEKTADIIKYAKMQKVRITPPKFGISGADYSCSPDERIIAKGISAIKGLGAKDAYELLEVSKSKGASDPKCGYDHFTDLLSDIRSNTSVNSGKLGTLINLDFFDMFGNQRELEITYGIFDKYADRKTVKKEEVEGSRYEEFIKRNSTDQTKSGKPATRYTILDNQALLRDCEDYVKSLHLPDYSLIAKAKYFAKVMGYSGYTTGKEEDMKKLYVKDIYPLKRKSDGKQFGYSVVTQSVGSGKEARFTLFNREYNYLPITKGDIIRLIDWTRDKGMYFTLRSYSILNEGDMSEVKELT